MGKIGLKVYSFKILENPYLRPKTVKLQEPTRKPNGFSYKFKLLLYEIQFHRYLFPTNIFNFAHNGLFHKFCELIKLIESIKKNYS